MTNKRVSSIIISLVNSMKECNSWRGETHIQKAIYFLQTIFAIDMEFNFILYKHGPFSFDLRDKLNDMLAERELRLIPQFPYGPSYDSGQRWEEFKESFQKMSSKYEAKIKFIAERLGDSGVNTLETLATALYFLNKSPKARGEARIAKLITLIKPHISMEQACDSVVKVRAMLSEAEALN